MTDIKMPPMGESIAEGTVSVWLVDVGAHVRVDEPLVTVSTDKADVDIPAPVSGVLREIVAAEGTTVPVGALIARIEEEAAMARPGEPVTAKPAGEDITPWLAPKEEPRELPEMKVEERPAPTPTPEGLPAAEAMRRPGAPLAAPPEIEREAKAEAEARTMAGFYSPAVMRLAVDYNIDLAHIKGTGQGGRVTKSDVMRAIREREAPTPPPHEYMGPGEELIPVAAPPERAARPEAEAAPEAREEAPPREAAPLTEEGFGTYRVPVYEAEPGDTVVEFTRLRRLIADHMVYSKRSSAHVTTFAEADMDKVAIHRAANKKRFKAEHGVSLTFLPYVILAAVKALAEYPLMNSVVQGGGIIMKKAINVGVAVDSERGLLVPVIKHAEAMGLADIAKAVDALSAKVRDRKIMPDELAGGTFTVSNPGKKGNLFGTPIIGQPQAACLRMGEVVKRAVVVEHEGEDAIAIRPMMYLSLSYDHRVVDGLTANEFLHRIREHLEEDTWAG